MVMIKNSLADLGIFSLVARLSSPVRRNTSCSVTASESCLRMSSMVNVANKTQNSRQDQRVKRRRRKGKKQ